MLNVRRSTLTALTTGLLAFSASACSDQSSITDPPSPVIQRTVTAAQSGRYIVVFRPSTDNTAVRLQAQSAIAGAKIDRVFNNAISGIAGIFPDSVVNALRLNPDVAYVEADQPAFIDATQKNVTWGLDRIDQRGLPRDFSYNYDADGSGVKVYIIDTGIMSGHTEFTGRILSGYDVVGDGRGTQDCNGHGTHVAGTVGGTTYGVAKGVRFIPVRVANCFGNGNSTGILAGIDWVISNATLPAVINMSLRTDVPSAAVDQAVARATQRGITVVVSAGNSNADACTQSPARAPEAITVGATDSFDVRAYFSNKGRCVDVFAPGENITSAGISSTRGVQTLSGTSMASPHVAGAAALFLQKNPSASPASVTAAILTRATVGAVSDVAGSPNLLLYTAPATTPVNQVPLAKFTVTCSYRTCTFDAATSSDPDGTLARYEWNFGDGTYVETSATSVSKTFAAAGTRTVVLRVTDNRGGTSSTSRSLAVADPPFTLAVRVTVESGYKYANLSWSGSSGRTDVLRDDKPETTTATNIISYKTRLGTGNGTRKFQVCRDGTTACSNAVTIRY